jgi:hypothetical protein
MDIEGPVADDAVPFDNGPEALVADWYMPAPHSRVLHDGAERIGHPLQRNRGDSARIGLDHADCSALDDTGAPEGSI